MRAISVILDDCGCGIYYEPEPNYPILWKSFKGERCIVKGHERPPEGAEWGGDCTCLRCLTVENAFDGTPDGLIWDGKKKCLDCGLTLQGDEPS